MKIEPFAPEKVKMPGLIEGYFPSPAARREPAGGADLRYYAFGPIWVDRLRPAFRMADTLARRPAWARQSRSSRSDANVPASGVAAIAQ